MKLTPAEKNNWKKKLSHIILNEKSHNISSPYEFCEVEDGFWEIKCNKFDWFEKQNK